MGKKAVAVHTVHYVRSGVYTIALPGTEVDLSDRDFESLTRLGAIRVESGSASPTPVPVEVAPVAVAAVEAPAEPEQPAKAKKPRGRKPKLSADELISEINDLVDDFVEEDHSIVG